MAHCAAKDKHTQSKPSPPPPPTAATDKTPPMSHQPGPTTAYFIVDVSALTKGLGNIRRWLESPATDVVLWIPSYTLHELDYLKKGLTMAAVNAREGIRLIEKTYSSDDPAVSRKVLIETPEEAGPKWKDCIRYKVRAPRVGEFPKTQKSASTAVPVTMSESEAAQLAAERDDGAFATEADNERAELPARLRHLLRPLIQKTHIDRENWIFVTEDNSTRIWCESFRVKCINVSQADALLFHTQTLREGNSRDDATINAIDSDFNRLNFANNPNDSGSPSEVKIKSGRRSRKKSPQSSGIGANVTTTPLKPNQKAHQDVKIESFDKIEFAPRGKGALWAP